MSKIPNVNGSSSGPGYKLSSMQWRSTPEAWGFCPPPAVAWGTEPPTTSGSAGLTAEVENVIGLLDAIVILVASGAAEDDQIPEDIPMTMVDFFFLAMTTFSSGWMNPFEVLPKQVWIFQTESPGPDLELLFASRSKEPGDPSQGYLVGWECDLLTVWWAAVHVAVDWADWYGWTSSLFPMSRLYGRPDRSDDGNSTVELDVGFAHTTPLYFLKRKNGYSPHLFFCNPSVAAYFSKYVVCRNEYVATPLAAIDRMVEWFGGTGESPYRNRIFPGGR